MPSNSSNALDVIAIGRSSVDLYGQQIGSRLEDIATFSKSVGGCPANIAIGTARLGLKSGLITGVGAEQMGRFIIEQCEREGVSTKGIKIDKGRLTALVLLAVEDEGVSPMIFYRPDCADMAIDENDVDEAFVKSSKSVLVSGTHFSRPNTEAAQLKAMKIAKANGGTVVFDIDYRPNLWGLAGHDAGFERYVKSDAVSSRLKTVLPDCDLIVGTEEEVLIASGEDNLLAALKTIRSLSNGTIVLKRGARAASFMTDRFPTIWKTASSAMASRLKSTMCWVRAMPSCPASCAAGCAAKATRPLPPGPMPPELSPFRASCVHPNM